ncbi:MAG: hypothetical protein ACE14S_00010 [Candidatus Bathyarchaeia archaeon]
MDCFLPFRVHPVVGVLNRYYGVMENGKVEVRWLETRRRDTPKFVYNAQIEMIDILAAVNSISEFYLIPETLSVVKEYRRRPTLKPSTKRKSSRS